MCKCNGNTKHTCIGIVHGGLLQSAHVMGDKAENEKKGEESESRGEVLKMKDKENGSTKKRWVLTLL